MTRRAPLSVLFVRCLLYAPRCALLGCAPGPDSVMATAMGRSLQRSSSRVKRKHRTTSNGPQREVGGTVTRGQACNARRSTATAGAHVRHQRATAQPPTPATRPLLHCFIPPARNAVCAAPTLTLRWTPLSLPLLSCASFPSRHYASLPLRSRLRGRRRVRCDLRARAFRRPSSREGACGEHQVRTAFRSHHHRCAVSADTHDG